MKLQKSILILLFFFLTLAASGQPVPETMLYEKAYSFMNENFEGGTRTISRILPVKDGNINSFYILQLEPGGWLLMSADLKSEPVIGFSPDGEFRIPEVNTSDPMYLWFSGRQNEIRKIITDGSLKEHKGWSRDKAAETKGSTTSSVKVAPFMQVHWGQGRNWNKYCPVDSAGPGYHTYVGCVAVSLAQAMSVYKHPEKGKSYNNYLDPTYGTQYVNFGNTVYYWDSMSVSVPDDFNSLLLYHCAVAVNMKFGADGSGTSTRYAASALRTYFGYSQKILYKERTVTDEEWHNLIIDQLINHRPVIYSGDSNDGSPGHAFNIDGVMNSIYFHINWGWNGSNDGYYTLDGLTVGSVNYNANNAAILGIQPYYYPTDVVLSDTVVLENQYVGTIIGVIKVVDEATDNEYTLKLECDSAFDGAAWITNYTLDGLNLRTGRVFSPSDKRVDTIYITVTDKFNNTVRKMILLSVGETATGIDQPESGNSGDFILYPNPAGAELHIYQKVPEEIQSIRIYSVSGGVICIIDNPGFINEISAADIAKGFYILEAELKDHRKIRRSFIKD